MWGCRLLVMYEPMTPDRTGLLPGNAKLSHGIRVLLLATQDLIPCFCHLPILNSIIFATPANSRMPEDPSIAIIRGLKVHIQVLDRFFHDNGCHGTYGNPPFYDKDPDGFSTLLRSKLTSNNTKTRLFVPSKMNHNQTNFGYVAWAYERVYSQREILLEEHLPAEPPEGWGSLRD